MIRPDHDRVLCAPTSRSGWSGTMRRAAPCGAGQWKQYCGALPCGLRLAWTRHDIMAGSPASLRAMMQEGANEDEDPDEGEFQFEWAFTSLEVAKFPMGFGSSATR